MGRPCKGHCVLAPPAFPRPERANVTGPGTGGPGPPSCNPAASYLRSREFRPPPQNPSHPETGPHPPRSGRAHRRRARAHRRRGPRQHPAHRQATTTHDHRPGDHPRARGARRWPGGARGTWPARAPGVDRPGARRRIADVPRRAHLGHRRPAGHHRRRRRGQRRLLQLRHGQPQRPADDRRPDHLGARGQPLGAHHPLGRAARRRRGRASGPLAGVRPRRGAALRHPHVPGHQPLAPARRRGHPVHRGIRPGHHARGRVPVGGTRCASTPTPRPGRVCR